jgi:hypothetical protein
MDGHIRRFHGRYRVIGAEDTAAAVAGRLDRLARERVPAACAEALERALGDDPAVYVLRRVDARLALTGAGAMTDAQVAQHWGERLAAAVLRRLAAEQDGGVFIRFTDQADYVARFIADLLAGAAWSRWYYAAFARLRERGVGGALRTVLLEQGPDLPAVLGRLHRLGALERLLSALEIDDLRLLWSRAAGIDRLVDQTAVRPLFAAALTLIDRLRLWPASRPDAEALLDAYLASGPAPVDWRDRRGLAVAVFDVLRFLAGRGHLRRAGAASGGAWESAGQTAALAEDGWESTASRGYDQRSSDRPGHDRTVTGREAIGREAAGSGGAMPPRSARQRAAAVADVPDVDAIERALAGLDWLDAAWLAAALAALLRESWTPEPGLPARRPAPGPTPRQRRLLDDLAAVVHEHGLLLDRLAPESAANALRLYALLIERTPSWAGDPLATATIEHLVHAWAWLVRTRSPEETLRRLRQGNLEGALRLPPTSGGAGGAGITALASIGEPALAVLEALVRGDLRPAGGDAGVIESECAGVFLLLRAALDAGLPSLAESAAYPEGSLPDRLPALCLTLALAWAGAAGTADGEVDPALALWAGLEQPPSLSALREIWNETTAAGHARFQAALLHRLAGQRLLRGEVLHLHHLSLGDGTPALVAGDATAQLWPLGSVLDPATSGELLAPWAAIWQQATGQAPRAVAIDATAAAIRLPDLLAGAEVAAVPEAGTSDGAVSEDAGDPAAAHSAGRAALGAALAMLDVERLGTSDARLTAALAAAALLRLWARWLPGFAASSVPYLIEGMVRRPGRLAVDAAGIQVELEPRPLDVVLRMAGYLADLEHVSWLPGRRVRFVIRGS